MRLADARLDSQQRAGALAALVKAKDSQLASLLRSLLGDAALRGPALRALATSEDPETAAAILAVYGSLPPAERRNALGTLCARAPYAKALLAAVADKRIAATDLSADLVTQLKALGNSEVAAALERVWGSVRELQADRAKLVEQYKSQLATPSNPPPDINLGRAMFAKTCQQCHTLFGVGGKVGPELTGANRSDVGYLLSNILDPSAVLAKEYNSSILVLDDGRVITGIVKAQDANTIAVQTQNELLTLARGDVETVKPSDKSMMPEDLLKPLTEREMRSLLAYLASSQQVPLLAMPDNAAGLFNGKDLTLWSGTDKLWSVEDGQIVGRTPGLAQRVLAERPAAGGLQAFGRRAPGRQRGQQRHPVPQPGPGRRRSPRLPGRRRPGLVGQAVRGRGPGLAFRRRRRSPDQVGRLEPLRDRGPGSQDPHVDQRPPER